MAYSEKRRTANQKWYQKNLERERAKSKKKYLEKKEQHLLTCRRWQANNKDRIKTVRTLYLESHRSKINETRRKYYQKTADIRRIQSKEWWSRNKAANYYRRKQRRDEIKLLPLLKAREKDRDEFYKQLWHEEWKRKEAVRRANEVWLNSWKTYVSAAKRKKTFSVEGYSTASLSEMSDEFMEYVII